MKERPKLLNTEMVNAVLGGRKTQTRIPIPSRFYGVEDTDKHDHSYFYVPDQYGDYHHILDFAGFPRVGDTLYIRETHFLWGRWERRLKANKKGHGWKFFYYPSVPIKFLDDPPDTICDSKMDSGYFKRPSIFMPKEYTRIWLKVKRVWVERLMDINPDGAYAEGIELSEYDSNSANAASKYVPYFIKLWNSIYGKTHNKWDNNRHVIACEFETTERPISTTG